MDKDIPTPREFDVSETDIIGVIMAEARDEKYEWVAWSKAHLKAIFCNTEEELNAFGDKYGSEDNMVNVHCVNDIDALNGSGPKHAPDSEDAMTLLYRRNKRLAQREAQQKSHQEQLEEAEAQEIKPVTRSFQIV